MAVRLVIFAGAYLALASLCRLFFPPSVDFVSFWLPSGLFVGTLLCSDTRDWGWYAVAALISNALFDIYHGIGPYSSVIYGIGNCLEAAIGAGLVRRYIAHRPDLTSVRQVAGLVGYSAILSTSVSALIGAVTVVTTEGSGSIGSVWLFWWGGNVIGVLLVTPIMLAWQSSRLIQHPRLRPMWIVEATLCLLASAVVSRFAFHSAPKAVLPLTYLVIPCLLWAAFRFGLLATACINVVVAGFSAWYSTRSFADMPFADVAPQTRFASHQLSLATVALTGLFLAAVLDERKKAQATLKESEEKYSRVFREAPVQVAITDLATGVFLEVNEESLRNSGFSRSEVIGHTAIELGWLTHEDRARLVDEIATHGRANGLEMSFTSKDGRHLFGLVYAEIMEIAGRRCVVSTSVDITGLKRAQEQLKNSQAALAESENRYRLLVEGSPQAVIVQLGGIVSYANPAAVRMLGAASERDLVGKPMLDLIHPDHHELVHQYRKEIAETGNNGVLTEMRYLKLDGTPIDVESQGSKILYNGQVGVQITVHEITARRMAEIERQQFEKKLQETQKLESLGVLAGGIAHDFNNILTGILGNASLAELELPDDSPAQDNLKAIMEGSQRAADLCRQMLAYSGKGRLVVQKVSLTRLVEETAHLLKVSVSKKAEMHFDLDSSNPLIEADATQIRQVVMNLVINASEAIGENPGVIRLRTGVMPLTSAVFGRGRTYLATSSTHGNYAYLEVADSGCGMSAETQAKIFDPFFTTKFTGRGLGLASVLGIVRGHHGVLNLDSTPGKGTTFKVLFPCLSGTALLDEAKKPEVKPWQAKGRVLVVDDEASVRGAASMILRKLGFEVEMAVDGLEALKIYKAEPDRFTMVLLDLTMPNLDGKQTFAELRKVRPAVRVVLMSGFNQDEAFLQGADGASVGFIQKPFEFGSLAQAVRAAVA